MIRVDETRVKAYGDRLDDGAVQLSFTLPVKASAEAKEAAKAFTLKMGLKDVRVVHMEAMGDQFTFFVVYGVAKHAINMKRIKVPKIDAPQMEYKELVEFMEKRFKEPIVVVGACTGHDAHTVGIDAIFNMKGFDMDYGLERYPLFTAINLRSQVDNRYLVEQAVKLSADAILVSQVVTQRDSHIKNLKALKKEISREKGLKGHLIKIIGGPRIDHSLARKLGFDAGFGPGTRPSQVASYIVHEYIKRTGNARRATRNAGRKHARHRNYTKSSFKK